MKCGPERNPTKLVWTGPAGEGENELFLEALPAGHD